MFTKVKFQKQGDPSYSGAITTDALVDNIPLLLIDTGGTRRLDLSLASVTITGDNQWHSRLRLVPTDGSTNISYNQERISFCPCHHVQSHIIPSHPIQAITCHAMPCDSISSHSNPSQTNSTISNPIVLSSDHAPPYATAGARSIHGRARLHRGRELLYSGRLE